MASPTETTIRGALDLLNSGFAFFRDDGELVFANRMARAALSGERRYEGLTGTIQELRQEAMAVARSTQRWEDPIFVERVVEAEGRRWWLRGTLFDAEGQGSGIQLMIGFAAMPETASEVSEGEIRQRFGLTRQEARVALLLAEGRTNQELATALGLSPHTARNYTRRVFRRLGVSNRAQVARQLLWRK